VSDAASSVRSKDGQADGSFGEIEGQRREGCHGTERKTNEQHCKVGENERHRREWKRQGDMCADGDESGGSDDEERFTGEGVLKRSGAMSEAELGGNGGLHGAGPF